MSLCLTIISYHKITPGQCVEITLDQSEITVGRGQGNDWVLSDPERLVSLKHCVIKFVDGRYFVTDNSTNGVELVVAGIRLRRGNSEPLQDGEIIKIGGYEISAQISSEALCDFENSNIGTAHSFDALMAVAKSPSQKASDALLHSPVWSESPQETVPDLFDFLTPGSVPSITRSDHVPAEQHNFRPPTVSAIPGPAVIPEAFAGADLIPADWADLSADQVRAAPRPVMAQAICAPSPNAASPDVLTAFLRGAGLEKLRIDDARMPAQMELIGRSYRQLIEGLIDILRARSSLKGEFRLQQTMIRPLENNPLKFAPNTDEALLLLLRHGNRAFMDPDQAIDDCFNDLRTHQLAVMAGAEASITALLKRFEPARLEARMSDNGALSRLFGSRQAQCWQRFTELYAEISKEVEDDFSELFGREFARAYEQLNTQAKEALR